MGRDASSPGYLKIGRDPTQGAILRKEKGDASQQRGCYNRKENLKSPPIDERFPNYFPAREVLVRGGGKGVG